MHFTYHVTYGAGWTTITKNEAREILKNAWWDTAPTEEQIDASISAAEQGESLVMRVNNVSTTRLEARINKTS